MHHRRAAVVGVLAASLAFTSSASAQLDEVNTKKLRDGVTVNGILQHESGSKQASLQFLLNGNTTLLKLEGRDVEKADVSEVFGGALDLEKIEKALQN